ncbi:hypothetical protein K7B10_00910 [Streptomyces flavotricini]|uniref:Uncharacterized protein n=1 Tax=Streptomyces flavotricini TaxID=66888 RepID=A0ABS8DX17_9ACTN|nr:hypothetical protein [Streptomyces flavotricini]
MLISQAGSGHSLGQGAGAFQQQFHGVLDVLGQVFSRLAPGGADCRLRPGFLHRRRPASGAAPLA